MRDHAGYTPAAQLGQYLTGTNFKVKIHVFGQKYLYQVFPCQVALIFQRLKFAVTCYLCQCLNIYSVSQWDSCQDFSEMRVPPTRPPLAILHFQPRHK